MTFLPQKFLKSFTRRSFENAIKSWIDSSKEWRIMITTESLSLKKTGFHSGLNSSSFGMKSTKTFKSKKMLKGTNLIWRLRKSSRLKKKFIDFSQTCIYITLTRQCWRRFQILLSLKVWWKNERNNLKESQCCIHVPESTISTKRHEKITLLLSLTFILILWFRKKIQTSISCFYMGIDLTL